MSKAGTQKTTEPDVQPTSVQPTSGGAIPALWGRISQVLGPRPASQTAATATAQTGQKPPIGLGRMAIGLVAYMVGSMALEYLILFVDNTYHLKLTTSVQTLFPTSWPLVGSMTKFTLIYLLLLVAYVWLLFRLNVIPRDLFGAKAAAARRAAERNTAATTTTLGRSKSARRRAGLTTTSSAATAVHGATTRRSGAAARLAREEALKNIDDGDDDEYHRVRSLNRRRRKR